MNPRHPKVFKGVLENAGLGEVAFYLKKAKQNLAYAGYALDNTDFDEVREKSKGINRKVELLKNTILEIDEEIDNLGLELMGAIEKVKESEDD